MVPTPEPTCGEGPVPTPLDTGEYVKYAGPPGQTDFRVGCQNAALNLHCNKSLGSISFGVSGMVENSGSSYSEVLR